MDARHYLLATAATAFALTASAAGLAVAVDPYRMFGTSALPGLTELKPRAYVQAELTKSYLIERGAWRTVVLGNSRMEIGLDPDSPAWPAEARPVFNAAMAGYGLDAAGRMLQQAIAAAPIRLALVGIDFQDFLVAPGKGDRPRPEDDARLLVDREGGANPQRTRQYLRDVVAATLTADAVADAFLTLVGQDPAEGVTMTRAGFNPLRDYRKEARRVGYHGLFAQKETDYRRSYARRPRPDFSAPERNAAMRDLRRILRLAAKDDVAVLLIVPPYHAQFLEMLRQVGLWQSFEAWKQAVVRLAVQESGNVRIVDFSGYNRITAEPVPPARDHRTEMRWYWEPGHFKSALGDLMLERLFAMPDVEADGAARFGRWIDSGNVEADLAAIRADRDGFERGSAPREAHGGGELAIRAAPDRAEPR